MIGYSKGTPIKQEECLKTQSPFRMN
jgi:hypothetical protein